MEWVPEFNFQLSVKLGGFHFPKGVFSRNKRICSEHISQKASIFDRDRQNQFMDDNFVFLIIIVILFIYFRLFI